LQEGKLIKLLKALDKDEFRHLEDYINSPFFLKKSKDVLLLYKAIKRQYPDFQSVVLAKKRVFKKVYPNQVYSDGKMRNLLSKSVKITENYLLYLDNEQNTFDKERRLIRIYGKRNIYDEFVRKINSFKKSLVARPYRDAEFYYTNYLLDSDLYFHGQTAKNKDAVDLLKSSLRNFEHYFVLERGKLGIDLKNRERIYKEYSDFKIDDFSKIIPNDNYIYQLYRNSLQLTVTKDEHVFREMEKRYLEKIDELGKDDQIIFFTILQNFTIHQLRINNREYLPTLFNLFKLGLNKKILFSNNKIKGINLWNAIGVGLQNGEINWAKSTIETYKHQIIEEKEGFTVTLSRGTIAFYEKKYLKTVNILNTFNLSDPLSYYGFKPLLIRASFKLFEENSVYYELFINHCLSFEKYLTRNTTIFKGKTEMHLMFTTTIKTVGKLHYKEKLTVDKKAEILHDLSKRERVSFKKWLIETISAIKVK